MNKVKRIVLSGGGTGGHIYPALALYRALKTKGDIEVLYIGTNKGLESKLVPQEGIPFEAVEITGLKRSLSIDNLKLIYKLFNSTRKAKKLIRDFQPDIVLGTGGYVCGPVLLAASRLKIPTMIHEQNSVAGITNKFLARFVNRIAVCFEEAESQFGKYQNKVVLTGNPRGQEVIATPRIPNGLSEQFGLRDDQPTVLVFGGSRGAPAINQAGIKALENWLAANYQVIIATGQSHFQQLEHEALGRINNSTNVRIVPYIDNMPSVFQAIDLVVCRAGATTLTELTALGLPSILIPSPYVTNNHQEHNALSLVNQNAAVMIKEQDLNGQTLFEAVNNKMLEPKSLEAMGKAAAKIGIGDASERIIQVMNEII
ncbi:undecaprenyldiphospho-muramoylpentapeptide beta-N-acetylglucosaminyltransferase [Facklamia miroungae]|uniref:UDP-N-acetylglucosamine--N-acetylmuramyl-(pentapeptide) pyrophosphoryl-undecaprenol N-acetylglucosamine transferase n=1 Tax=Facklamia miroungae TaxID=120956 RepID=A0A1G7TTX0_9LACT|nr:undecaprenyldiphospho-muramoylpentapeptide beta-N-acetylglucosaminyltransferase [Facklamia miroungae]NKZ29969.1 undecaprenyldiphospho-muramoylpentapeptide beta-N-acetylglucosaminyltransferase [Facklamia miroungae]SDG38727.1 UDP-N-acetylglucosamine--N-acetylmuramyl-(pentapeptide) pyrophosphoryl-undecaprenol N-acetylglucosamine transferase [Facklamia miroungae]